MKKLYKLLSLALALLMACACLTSCIPENVVYDILDKSGLLSFSEAPSTTAPSVGSNQMHHSFFDGDAYAVVNDNKPMFNEDEITTSSFETYAALDSLGRCGVTIACIGKDIMPTEDRESISSVYPSGWKHNGKSNNKKYDFVDGSYIYNRCHLIGFQLTGENANEKNLITGTRYLNIEGMLPFEDMVADTVRQGKLHVMYRVTPIYDGDNLVPEGVLMEGYSVEDAGKAVSFCIFAFNVQPGVEINYATGENKLAK
jgi:DNA-entry nuclease